MPTPLQDTSSGALLQGSVPNLQGSSPQLQGASLQGTMTTPTPPPPPPAPTPVTPPGGAATQQPPQQQPVDTTQSNPGALSQAMAAIQNQVVNNNNLVNQKNLILKHLYDQPLSDADKAQLDPALASVLNSGDRNAIDFNLKLLNDQIAGRTNTLAQNVQYLTEGYNTATQQAETRKQDAINNVLNYAKANGQKPSVILQALYPDLAKQLGPQLDQIAAPYGQYIPLSGGSGGGVNGYDISTYATNPNYSNEISSLATQIGQVSTADQAQNYISNRAPNSPITGQMVIDAAQKYGVDPTMMLAIMTQETQLGTDGSKGALQDNYGNVGNNDTLMAAGGSVAKSDPQAGVDAVAQWLSKHKASGNIDATTPSGPGANIIDPTTGLTPNGLYAAALQYAANGTMPSLGLGSAPQTKNARQQIISKAGAILAANGGTIAGNKAQISANAKALSTQTDYLNTIQRALTTAENTGVLTQQLFQNKNINPNDSTIANKTINDLTKLFGDSGDIRAYQAAMVEVGNDYAQVFSRGGQRSVEGNALAQELVNGNVKLSDIQKTLDTLQQIGQINIQTAQGQVNTIQNQINNVVNPGGSSGADNDPLGILTP